MLNLTAPFVSSTSYGLVALNILAELEKMGVETVAIPIGDYNSDPERPDQGWALDAALKRFDKLDPAAPSVRLFHQFSLKDHIGFGERIGMPIFELNKFNQVELDHLSSCQRLIVCSHWAKAVVEDQLSGKNIPIGVVPLGVDTEVFSPGESLTIPSSDATVFISLGKWEKRKGHDFIAQAFRAAFSPSDNAMLLVMAYNPFIGPMNDQWAAHYQQLLGPQVRFFPRLPTSGLVDVMRGADCFLSVSRAEGFDLPALEALALGKQVIGTYFSAHTEFMTEENTLLVYPDKLEIANDNLWFRPENTEGGEWMAFGESQFEQLVAHMREVHRKKMMGESLFNQAGVETAQKFSWTNSARRLVDFVNN